MLDRTTKVKRIFGEDGNFLVAGAWMPCYGPDPKEKSPHVAPKWSTAIKHFLDSRSELASLYRPGMEVFVEAAQDGGTLEKCPWTDGDGVEHTYNAYFDRDLNSWKDIRLNCQERDTRPTWSLQEHALAIGMSGWNYAEKLSHWIGLDIDSQFGHKTKKALSDEELEQVIRALDKVPYVTLRRSKGGKGIHAYVHFAQPAPSDSLSDHIALAKAVRDKLAKDSGLSLDGKIDAQGLILYQWHRDTKPGGLELIRAAVEQIEAPSRETWFKKMTAPKPIIISEDKLLKAGDVLANSWPREKSDRTQRALAISGWLLPRGFSVDQVKTVIERAATGDEELAKRLTAVDTTRAKLDNGGKATGRPTVEKLFGVEVVGKIEKVLGTKKARAKSQVDELLTLTGGCTLTAVEDKAYVTFLNNGHRETWPILSKGFKRYLRYSYRQEFRKSIGAEALKNGQEDLVAQAFHEGNTQEVFVRIGEKDGSTFIDLCNKDWQMVKITDDGWNIVQDGPTFKRTSAAKPLDVPERGGSIDDLWQFMHLPEKWDQYLFLACLAAAFQSRGPYPVVSFSGEPGSGKSTNGAVFKNLVDPYKAVRRTCPKDARDLAIAACNSWLLNYDNLSEIPEWLSDSFCRVATGAGFSTRELYENEEECIFEYMRPLCLNGIPQVIERSDLTDRAVCFAVPQFSSEGTKRRTERAFWAGFYRARPKLLGAIFDLLCKIRMFLSADEEGLPRMGDFATIGIACEKALGWPSGEFMRAYASKTKGSHLHAVMSSPVGRAVREMLAETQKWIGTASKLLEALPQKEQGHKDWPRDGTRLSGELRRLAPSLRETGYGVEFTQVGKAKTRTIELTAPDLGESADAGDAGGR